MNRLSLLNVLVNDQSAALAFYRDKLGFVVTEDLPFGERRWVTVRAADDSTMAITLELARSPEDQAVVGRQGGSEPLFGLATDDCVRDYERLRERGVEFLGEPQVLPYGTGVTLRDLYGNKIYLNQET